MYVLNYQYYDIFSQSVLVYEFTNLNLNILCKIN